MDKILIIGAGFSNNLGCPVEKKVIETAILNLEKFGNRGMQFMDKFKIYWDKFFPGLNPWEQSIEELLSRLDLEMKYSFDCNKRKFHKLSELHNLVLSLFWLTLQKIPDKNDLGLLSKFFCRTNYPVLTISFNQDLLVEHFCEDQQISWRYHPSLPAPSKENIHFFKTYHSFQNYELESPQICLLKLHGSFNLYYCPDCLNPKLLRIRDAGCYPFYDPSWPGRQKVQICDNEECGSTTILLPLIIAPSALKQYDFPIINNQFFVAREELRRASELVFFGYSMREEDSLAVNLFYKLAEVNNKIKSVIVIDINKEVSDRISQIINFEASHYPSLEDFLINCPG